MITVETAEDVLRQLVFYGSEEVAGAIVALADELDDAVLREVLLAEWTRCEAHRPYRVDIVRLFRRVGFVADAELPARLRGQTATVYRGNLGGREPVGISWTLSRKQAEFFAAYPMTARGRLLGTWSDDGIPTVWRGSVRADDVLAYFDGGGEREVVLDPATVRSVEPISTTDPEALWHRQLLGRPCRTQGLPREKMATVWAHEGAEVRR